MSLKKLFLFIALFTSFNLLYAQEQAERSLTEYRVESFQTPLVAKKMLYDWLGKWDNVLYNENNQPLLVWSNKNIINEYIYPFIFYNFIILLYIFKFSRKTKIRLTTKKYG